MNSQQRILTIALRLLQGQRLTKQNLVNEFECSEVSIRRDIMQITDIFAQAAEPLTVCRNHAGEYWLAQAHFFSGERLDDTALTAVLMILTASRGLPNQELQAVVKTLQQQADNPELIEATLRNELFNYRGVAKTLILPRLVFIQQVIKHHHGLRFQYVKGGTTQSFTIWPEGVLFSDLYFYVVDNQVGAPDDPEHGDYRHYRVANMFALKEVAQRQIPVYAKRFQAGQLHRQTPLAYLGRPITLTIEYYDDPNYVLDRFPDSKILWTKPAVTGIEMHVNDGYGVRMWLLQQAGMVKVLHPVAIKNYVVRCLQEALQHYE